MMEKAKPILKNLILGLVSLVAVLGLILIPMMNCAKPAKADTDSYLLLEYIEGNGTQYIDTGYTPNANTKVVLDFQYTATPPTWRGLMGSNQGGSTFALAQYDNGGNLRTISEGNVGGVYTSFKASITFNTQRHTSILDAKNTFATLDSTVGTGSSTVNYSDLSSILIFALNSNGGVSAKVYSSQIYNNGVLARDFVPVKRSSDGVIGMLDRVNGTFYGNSGTGTFGAGYLSNEYYVCDYLQSDGSQYIDTGVTPSSNELTDASIKYDALTATKAAFGVRWNDQGTYKLLDFVWSDGSNLILYDRNNNATLGAISLTTRYDISIRVVSNSTTYYNSNSTFGSLVLDSSVTSPYSVYLFGANYNNSSSLLSNIHLYRYDHMTSYVMDRNMIPVYDPNTNQAGMWDNVNGQWYGNLGTGSFSYSITGGATIYQASNESDLSSALTSSVSGDLIILTDNITVSTQTILSNAPIYLRSYSLGSSYHPNSALYTVEGWYTSQWSGKLTGSKMSPSTIYIARYQADVNSATTWGLVIGNSLSGDILNITGGFTYTTSSFTIPANVTVNKNSFTILPPANPPMSQVGYNSDAASSTDATTFVANTTYYAIYVVPSYTARLIIDPEVSIDISGIAGASRTEYASYSSIDFSYSYGTAIQFPLPSWDLHSFNGWWLNGTVGPYSGISSTDSGNLVFYAKWVEAPEITIGNVNIYRNLIESGDRLIIFTSNIDWENLPNDNVRTMFMFRLMDADGTSVIASTQPYYAYNGGYYLQVAGFYFPDYSVIEWGEEYQIRIDGNPSKWYTISDVRAIYNISGVEYTEQSSQENNQTELEAWIINVTSLLENDWLNYMSLAPLITTNTSGNQVLTNPGQAYYLNTIQNINLMAPSLFSSGAEINPIIPDNPMPEIPASPSLIERWENQYEGTWVQESFQALGDLFHVNWRTITSILCLVIWVIFAAISQMKWGTTDAGLWMGAVMFGVMITMGLMNWAVVITAAVLMTLYSVYIVFWRQG